MEENLQSQQVAQSPTESNHQSSPEESAANPMAEPAVRATEGAEEERARLLRAVQAALDDAHRISERQAKERRMTREMMQMVIGL